MKKIILLTFMIGTLFFMELVEVKAALYDVSGYYKLVTNDSMVCIEGSPGCAIRLQLRYGNSTTPFAGQAFNASDMANGVIKKYSGQSIYGNFFANFDVAFENISNIMTVNIYSCPDNTSASCVLVGSATSTTPNSAWEELRATMVAGGSVYGGLDLTITKNATTNGTFTVSNEYPKLGDEVTLSFAPEKGYKVSNVTIKDQYDNNVTSEIGYNSTTGKFTMAGYPVYITVGFYQPKYNITKSETTHGRFTVDKETEKEGDTVTLSSITPEENYVLKKVTILKTSDSTDITSLVNYNKTTNTFEVPDYDVTVQVEFEVVPFKITVNNALGAKISEYGIIKVNPGGSKEIIILPMTGYRIKSVFVDNVEQILPLTNNKLTFNNVSKDINVVITAEKNIYNFDIGEKIITYTVNKDKKLEYRIGDTEFENFDKVYVNNKELSKDKYTASKGSIIITLKEEYLNTLENGTYDLKVTTLDSGEANTQFVIANSQVGLEENPKTGDGIMNSILLGAISIIGILEYGLSLNKNKRYN